MYVYIYICMWVYMHVCAKECRGQRLTSGVMLRCQSSFLLFWDRNSLYSPDWPWVQRFTHFCLSAEIKYMQHHTWPSPCFSWDRVFQWDRGLAHRLGWLARKPKEFSCFVFQGILSCLPSIRIISVPAYLGFYVAAGTWIQVPMPVQPALYCPSPWICEVWDV